MVINKGKICTNTFLLFLPIKFSFLIATGKIYVKIDIFLNAKNLI